MDSREELCKSGMNHASLFSAFDSSGAKYTKNNFLGAPKMSDSQPLFLFSFYHCLIVSPCRFFYSRFITVLSFEYIEEENKTF